MGEPQGLRKIKESPDEMMADNNDTGIEDSLRLSQLKTLNNLFKRKEPEEMNGDKMEVEF